MCGAFSTSITHDAFSPQFWLVGEWNGQQVVDKAPCWFVTLSMNGLNESLFLIDGSFLQTVAPGLLDGMCPNGIVQCTVETDFMTSQACEFVELSALLTSHYHLALDVGNVPSSRNIEGYWTASRCRFNRWARQIKRMEVIQEHNQADLAEFLWCRIQPTLTEILTSEILTRVCAALAMIHNQQSGDKDWVAVAESIFSGHQEARQRTLRIILAQIPPPDSIRRDMERLRRQAERWNDLFLGFLAVHTPMDAFAFSPQRVEDFADGLRYDQSSVTYSWPRLQRGLHRAFHKNRICRLPNTALNDQIMLSMYGVMASAALDLESQFPTMWRMRLNHLADNADALIQDMLCDDVEVPAGLIGG